MVYEPYGKIRHNYKAGSYGNDYTFTGKELDSETSLQYFGARYYSGIAGRFTSSDPIFLALGSSNNLNGLKDPQAWNSYAYGRNNPYRMVDPDGQAFWDVARALSDASTIFLNVATSIIPGVSDYRDFVESTTGRDMITGQQLSTNQLSLTTGALIIPGIVSGAELRASERILETIDTTRSLSRSINTARRAAVREAWSMERDMVLRTGVGTRDWTADEITELMERGKVSGYEGHHINSVGANPDLARDPNNIEFVTRNEHLENHDGSWNNPTSGDLIDR